MPRMLNPSPGEAVDRQTILELKIENGASEITVKAAVKSSGKVTSMINRQVVTEPTSINIRPFMDELEAVIDYLTKKWIPGISDDQFKVDIYDKLYEELAEVNAGLWRLEDQIRVLKNAPDKHEDQANRQAAEVAFTIVDLNDKRASLVKKINAIWNINSQEKQY